nr:unnamed protein product [Digitaria exilis]CAB3504289.1 unnamed protein product [Digitaria exilis]
MAASASAAQPDHHRTAGTERPRGAKHRKPLLNHLHIQVPANHSGCHSSLRRKCQRERPASPSLLRSPSAWIRAKGHNFGSSSKRRSGNFHYDARSYAQNFDEGGDDEDAPRHQCFSPGIPTTASQVASPSSGLGASGNGKDEPAARETAGQRGLVKAQEKTCVVQPTRGSMYQEMRRDNTNLLGPSFLEVKAATCLKHPDKREIYMEPARKMHHAAGFLLLLLVVAIEMGPVQAGECLSRSTAFKSLCVNSDRCNDVCLKEGKGYSGGKCGGIYLTCWCITPCAAGGNAAVAGGNF